MNVKLYLKLCGVDKIDQVHYLIWQSTVFLEWEFGGLYNIYKWLLSLIGSALKITRHCKLESLDPDVVLWHYTRQRHSVTSYIKGCKLQGIQESLVWPKSLHVYYKVLKQLCLSFVYIFSLGLVFLMIWNVMLKGKKKPFYSLNVKCRSRVNFTMA